MLLPDVALLATDGISVNCEVSAAPSSTSIAYGRPGQALPTGWTHSRRARLHAAVLRLPDISRVDLRRGVAMLFGLSTQETAYQREAPRLHLPS